MGYLPDGTYVSELEARVQELAAVLGNFKTAYANAHDAQLAAEARVRELEEQRDRAERLEALAIEQRDQQIARVRELEAEQRNARLLVSAIVREAGGLLRVPNRALVESDGSFGRVERVDLDAVEFFTERQALAEQKPCTLECDPSCPDHKTCEHAEQEPS